VAIRHQTSRNAARTSRRTTGPATAVPTSRHVHPPPHRRVHVVPLPPPSRPWLEFRRRRRRRRLGRGAHGQQRHRGGATTGRASSDGPTRTKHVQQWVAVTMAQALRQQTEQAAAAAADERRHGRRGRQCRPGNAGVTLRASASAQTRRSLAKTTQRPQSHLSGSLTKWPARRTPRSDEMSQDAIFITSDDVIKS